MRPTSLTTAFPNADDDSICLSQALGAAGNLVIAGALASGGVATLTANTFLTITSGGNDLTVTFTAYGTNSDGQTLSQSIAGTNGGVATLTAGFQTVTRVAANAAVATTVKVGTAQAGVSAMCPIDIWLDPTNIALGTIVTGTVNYTVQATLDDIWSTSFNPGTATWYDHPTLAAKTASDTSNYAFPPRAIRLKQASGSGTTVLNIVQSGVAGSS